MREVREDDRLTQIRAASQTARSPDLGAVCQLASFLLASSSAVHKVVRVVRVVSAVDMAL
jgi:hypothetical protein